MKKIILGLFLFLFMPFIANAADYKIENYYIDASLKTNGDMEVAELIVMKGSFNGYELGLEYNTQDKYSASALNLEYISGKSINSDISWDILNDNFNKFQKVDAAYNGDILKYTEEKYSNKNNYRLYYKTTNSTTAFLVKYTLKDVALLHNDCVELYWNFFSDSFRDDVKDLQIRVNLPKNIDKDAFNWWFHGSLTGNSDYKNGVILAKLDKLEAYSPVDFRVLLPREIFDTNSIKKIYNDDIKESTIKSEDEIVAKDLKTIKRIHFIYYLVVTLTIIFFVVLILTWIYVYRKYDKERKAKYFSKYNREFIEDYNVEVIDYLMNKKITPNAMSASIMNLIYKKNINFEEIANSKKKNYKFILNNKEGLNTSELKLIGFLFDKVGNGTEFTTQELKKYASGTKTCETFLNTYTSWQKQVIKDGEAQDFFETKQKGKTAYGLLILLFATIISIIGLINNVEFIFAYLTFFAAVIFLIYIGLITKKTEKGIEHYTKWKAFKNFLNDFGAFEIKELPEVVLWERYLVYATIFGLADKVEKAMNVRISEMNIQDMNANIYISPHIHIGPVINSSINSAYNNAQIAVNRANANASGGSFGGHGGGFSSGGGFGGGGRSGGGF